MEFPTFFVESVFVATCHRNLWVGADGVPGVTYLGQDVVHGVTGRSVAIAN